jgi:hypothetical protein
MDVDPRIIVGAAIALTVILWAIAIALQRVDSRVTVRGFRNGSIVAVGIFIVTALIVAIFFNGREIIFATLDLRGAFALGVFVGLVFALGYLWLGSLVMAIGLIFNSKPAWSTVGTWAAVPVIVVSLGFGYVSFRSVQQEGTSPSALRGSVALQLAGEKLGAVDVIGNAQCEYDGTGALRLRAGGGVGGSTIATPDGRQVYVKFDLDGSAIDPSIQVIVGSAEADPGKGWQPGPDTIALAPGSTTHTGSALLSDLVPVDSKGHPDPTERWSGKVSWTCTSAP